MNRPALSAHERHRVLTAGRRIAAELAREACDLTTDLPMVDRTALAALSLAVDETASRRAGVSPRTAEVLPVLAADLARIERLTHPAPLRAVG